MAGDVTVIWDDAAVRAWIAAPGSAPLRAVDEIAAMAVVTMKALIPVSPVQPAYASPVPEGRSRGTAYRGRGLARPSGPDVSRQRSAGDLPLRPSGYLRSSVVALRIPDGTAIIGPTAPYARFVNDGTAAHEITSHGPWPLRNRATGQVFGRHVRHPGTTGAHYIEKTADALGGTVIRVER